MVLSIARVIRGWGVHTATLDLGGEGGVEKFGSWDGTLFRKKTE
jgi:hypothetical protein